MSVQEILRGENFAYAMDEARTRGEGYGVGSIQGYHARCQCHRGFGCSPWTKQGLYDLKMARETSVHFYVAGGRIASDDPRSRLSEEEANALRREFLVGFRIGLAKRRGPVRSNSNQRDGAHAH